MPSILGNPAQFIHSYELWQVVIEMTLIWVGVYVMFRLLRGTRGASILKGFAIIFVLLTLLIRVVGRGTDTFGRLNFIYDRFLQLLAIVLIVVFQPELRQAMIRLSHTRHFRRYSGHAREVVEAISEAANFLSKNQFGALIAIERSVKLGRLIDGGQELDARISARLLESIFWPNGPLHDLGVVVRDNRVLAAGVQFPLAEEGLLPPRTGARHRAAVGLTVESDAIVVIVSEETGGVSIAEGGTIEFDIARDKLETILAKRLAAPAPEPKSVEPESALNHAENVPVNQQTAA